MDLKGKYIVVYMISYTSILYFCDPMLLKFLVFGQ